MAGLASGLAGLAETCRQVLEVLARLDPGLRQDPRIWLRSGSGSEIWARPGDLPETRSEVLGRLDPSLDPGLGRNPGKIEVWATFSKFGVFW